MLFLFIHHLEKKDRNNTSNMAKTAILRDFAGDPLLPVRPWDYCLSSPLVVIVIKEFLCYWSRSSSIGCSIRRSLSWNSMASLNPLSFQLRY